MNKYKIGHIFIDIYEDHTEEGLREVLSYDKKNKLIVFLTKEAAILLEKHDSKRFYLFSKEPMIDLFS